VRLTVREAAALLQASDQAVYDWIESGGLPAYRVSDQYRINRSELLEWATARNLPVAPGLFREGDKPAVSLADALERGGVFHDVAGGTREEALGAAVALLPLEEESDREMLLSLLLARGAEAAVPLGGGIAIPHVRDPIALAADATSVALFFLRHPVDFQAPDGQPVYALFFLVSPNTRAHLETLAKLAHLLRSAPFREAIARRAPREEILETARRLEA
jgi:PTS system nitrogen regulatory IIA component